MEENENKETQSSATSSTSSAPSMDFLKKMDTGTGNFFVQNVLLFDKLIATKAIYVLYYLGLLGVIGVAVNVLVTSLPPHDWRSSFR